MGTVLFVAKEKRMVDKKIIKKLEEENIRFVSEITYNKKIYVKAMKILKKRNRIYIL